MKKLKLFSILFILVFACTEQNEVDRSIADQMRTAEFNSEQIGQMFYDRINTNALEDPMKDLGVEERQSFTEKFDKLKAKGTVSAKDVLDEQLSEGHITRAIHQAILQYNDDLYSLVQETSDVMVALRWCLDREEVIKKQADLTDFERARILIHQAILRNYIQATLEKLPDAKERTSARVEGWKSILCYVGCAIDNITAFSSVGAIAGTYGEIIGAGVGLIYTIVGGATACPNCAASPPPCQYATSISSPDVCYMAGGTKTFTAWGYGTTPIQFAWDFYDGANLNVPFFTFATSTDQYTITAGQLGGRTNIAVRVRSNCSGTEKVSQYIWFSITDAGKARPKVLVSELGGNLARYTLGGANNVTNSGWSFIPPYRGSLVAGSYSSTTITIQWVSAQMRIGANVTTSGNCGGPVSATAY
jgi:hypothetical protein